jgi:glutaredoxin
MTTRRLLAGLALATLACGDAAAPAGSPAEAETEEAKPAAARPAGFESLDDESQALRLYYQFVDERRQVRFVESLDDVPEPLRAGVGFVKMAVPPPLSPGDARRARHAQVAKSGGVVAATGQVARSIVLYSADWCGACTKAKRYLARRGTAYEERNVDNPKVAQKLFELTGGRGIPVIDVGGRVLTGFSAASYDRLLDGA